MKNLLLIGIIILASCSEDPEPQISCNELKSKVEMAQRAIVEHQAKGSNGNPGAWESELRKLVAEKDKLQGEYIVRRCN